MNKYVLKAEKRILTGSKVKKLRRQGVIPANVFGHTIKSQAIQVSEVEFSRVYKDAGETSLIWLKVEGEDKERPTLIKALTNNPTTGKRYHVDFHQVNLKEKVSANVPVEITGEAQMVKDGLAVLDINLHEIEVEALPTDIPESVIFDISTLKEIGDNLKLSDVKIPAEAEVTGTVPTEGEATAGEKPAETPKAE